MILFAKIPAEGIFTKENILLRLPEVLSWYEILDLFDKDCLKKNITKELLSKKEAKQKEVSIDLIETSKLFRTFTAENLNSIKWIKPIDFNDLLSDLLTIADDILEGKENKLYAKNL
ncbi:MAG: hypothetical protein ACK4UV_07600 [Ignavibacterium sp.]